ncbi:MAG TPA: hypothetical protein VLY87_05635 [Flavobacterium sp.]|nr:hypothetical protein [Flavobacterium sp.]
MFQKYLYSVLLTVTLLFSNVGLAVNIHYCGNEIEKIELGYASSMNCGDATDEESCCGDDEPKVDGCCKDEIIKQQADEVIVKVFQTQQITAFVVPAVYKLQSVIITEISLPKSINRTFYCNRNAPPLYKLHQQFLLYA